MNLEFRPSNSGDLLKIYDWLSEQERKGVQTFLCNWNLTKDTHERGELIVAVSNDTPIAYIFRDFGILEVKADYRRKGIGTRLVNYALNLLMKSGELYVRIECTPSTSIPFWKKMGFTLYDEKFAYKLLEKKTDIPPGGIPIKVQICFYPANKKWNTEVQPIEVFQPKAYKFPDNVIYLEERISIFSDQQIWDGDPVIGIWVSDNELYLNKAKYGEAKQLGVLNGSRVFTVEKIRLV